MNESTDTESAADQQAEDATRVVASASFKAAAAPATPSPATEDFDATVPPAAAPAAAPIPTPVAASKPPSSRMSPGQILGHTYEIEAHVARGGMGDVYRARHIELGTQHAIKVILPELAEDPKIISLFQEEARKLSRMRNDAIVGYEGLFRDENGVRYLVMEFVDGTSLSRIIRQGPLSVEDVRQLRDRCAMGLAAAHEKRIFHRDIAPDNIILVGNRADQAKIIDFGIAKSADPGDKTVIGQDFAGKYSYVSPEQLGLYGGAVDGRSDIYSLGLVLVAAAAGRALDMGNSPVSVIEARRAVPDLGTVPEELRAELAPLLEPDPANRPQSMRALPGARGAEMTGWAQAFPAAEPARAPATQPGSETRQSAKSAEPEKGGSKKGVAIAAGIGAFLLVAGGGAFFLFSGKQEAPPPVIASAPTPQPQPAPAVAPPPQAAPQPAPPVQPAAPTVSLPALQAALADIPCARVKASVGSGGAVTMDGFVGTTGDLTRLTQLAQQAGAASVATTSVKLYAKPHCEIATLMDGNPVLAASPRPTIAFDNASKLYRDGAQIAITATAPAATELKSQGGYLYLEYFATDGTVVHMLPTPRVAHNQLGAGASTTVGTLNTSAKADQDQFAVAAPYGPTMILAIMTSKPLFQHARPQQEQAAEYMKELKRRLALDGQGEPSPLVAAGYEIFDVEP
jgi:hypothetical protein